MAARVEFPVGAGPAAEALHAGLAADLQPAWLAAFRPGSTLQSLSRGDLRQPRPPPPPQPPAQQPPPLRRPPWPPPAPAPPPPARPVVFVTFTARLPGEVLSGFDAVRQDAFKSLVMAMVQVAGGED